MLGFGFRSAGIAALTLALAAIGGAGTAVASAGVASAPHWRVAYSSDALNSGLTDGVALSASDVWAVGDSQGNSGAESALIRRWNGRKWTSVALPSRYRNAVLSVVAGSSAKNVWVFGYHNVGSRAQEFALRWNGSWSARGDWATSGSVYASAVITPRNVWAFGSIGTWHFNGSKWRRVSLPFTVLGASVLSGNDIWAVGPDNATDLPQIGHFHDGKWTTKALPHIASSVPGPAALALVALSDRDIWVVGGTVTKTGYDRPLALHLSGGKWRPSTFPLAYNWLNTVVPDGSGGLWAAYAGPYGASVVAHFTGGHWRNVTLPHVKGKSTSAFVVTRVPRSRTVFAVGTSVWGRRPATSALVLKYS